MMLLFVNLLFMRNNISTMMCTHTQNTIYASIVIVDDACNAKVSAGSPPVKGRWSRSRRELFGPNSLRARWVTFDDMSSTLMVTSGQYNTTRPHTL